MPGSLRFTGKGPDEPSVLDPAQGFGRFTDRARNVVMTAQNEARAARNDTIRPEHLVLGLLAEPDGVAAKVIVAQGVALESVRRAATAALPPAGDDAPALVPFDGGAKKVLELTAREALLLGHNYVGTEHLLLALLELDGGTGVLGGLGLDKAAVTAAVEAALAEIRATMQ